MRDTLQPWAGVLEKTYNAHQVKGTGGASKSLHLPKATRDDVCRLATLCISLDICANTGEDGKEEHGENQDLDTGKKKKDNKTYFF